MPGLPKPNVPEMALWGQRACASVTSRAVTAVPSSGSSRRPHLSAEPSEPAPSRPRPPVSLATQPLPVLAVTVALALLLLVASSARLLFWSQVGQLFTSRHLPIAFLAAASSCKDLVFLTFILPPGSGHWESGGMPLPFLIAVGLRD